MTSLRMPIRTISLAVLAVTALAAASSGALRAQTNGSGFTPSVLLRFTGNTGAAIGGLPYAPPLLSRDGLSLRGTTLAGGPSYGTLNYTQSTAYQFALADSGYLSSVLGVAYGHQFTTSVQDSNGILRAGASQAGSAGTTGVTFGIAADGGTSLDALPDSSVVSAANFSPNGQIAIDGQDNMYFGSGTVSATCAAGNPSSANSLWRRSAAGALSRVVNFCDFLVQSGVDSRNNPLYLHAKGGGPVALAWSETDQALYGLTQVASTAVDPSLPAADNSGRSVGTLFRIGKAALNAGVGAADAASIEVLHTFARARDGAPVVLATAVAGDSRASSLVEDGEWLYGTTYYNGSSTTAAGGTVWRVHKTRASSFEVVHYFHGDASKDGTAEADASNPTGPLVRAADGNIYGTATRDGSSMSGTTATGAGALYRIVVGQAADRSDDRFELLHRFNATTEGARPVGLTLGASTGGVQKLYGATRQGGASDTVLGTSASSTTGYGALFAIDVPLPTVSFTTQLSASITTARVGDTLTLSWATRNAASCTASGDNGGIWGGAQQTQGNRVPPAGPLGKAGLNTFTLKCESVNGGPAVTETVSVNVEAATTTTPTTPTNPTTPTTPVPSTGGGGGPLSFWLLAPLIALGLGRRFARRA